MANVQVYVLIALLLVSKLIEGGRKDASIEANASFWNDQARLHIEQALKRKENTRVAKNIIFFLGDGMGISTVAGGRIRKGQMAGELGEDHITEMEQFAHLGLAKTYNIDYQTPDSAATATAYLCGVKGNLGTIGVDGRAKRKNCPSTNGTHVESIFDWAQALGKKVGIITTTRVTHASPAGAYAHVAERDWESFDGRLFSAAHAAQGCKDIAYQLMTRNPPLDLVLGGGRRPFFPTTTPDVEYPAVSGSRVDNRSLIDEFWRGKFIWNKTQLDAFELGSATPLLGLFEPDHMLYEVDRRASGQDKPSLSRMTEFALEHFLRSNTSFVLFVEGGKIDHGHHETKARQALDEYVEFDNAIGQAKAILQAKGVLDDTLMVVSADHSNVFTIGADGARGANIFGFGSLENRNVSEIDGAPVHIIAYGNGFNFKSSRNATYLYSVNTNSTNYLSPTAQPLTYASHAADDVPVYAQGPWSHLFIGTYEQNTIPHKMAYAACMGAYKARDGCSKTSAATRPSDSLSLAFVLIAFVPLLA